MEFTVEHERIRFVELRRRLLELHPDLDEQTLSDTLDGATDLREALAALIRSALDDECLAGALKARLEAMKARHARLEARASAKRLAAVENMAAAGVPKLTEPDFTASLRRGPPGVDVFSPVSLPVDYLVPQPPKPDKRAILDALTCGRPVPGAALVEPKVCLAIRSQ